MSKTAIFTLLIFVSGTAIAAPSIEFVGKNLSNDSKVEAVKINKMLVSQSCATGCEAIKALASEKPLKTSKLSQDEISQNCIRAGGTPDIIRELKSDNDFSFCIFKDGSFINSWDLFEATKPK